MEKWGSWLGFILASIGSAVGIGNIWRFSAVVGQNGGGAYLIPYLIAIAAFGVPLMILELTVGRCLRGDVVSAFRRVGAGFEAVGWLVWVVVFGVLSYYLVIIGWTLGYVFFAAAGSVASFGEFTSGPLPLLFFGLTAVLVGLVVSQGVKKGIERITSVLIPLAFIILVGMAAYSVTLPGFWEGVGFLFTPDFSVLGDPLIWSAAFGQAFFSLSVGFGTLITYGSYLDDGVDVPRSSVVITVADLSAAVLSGLVIFPIVFSFGLQPSMGTELAFVTLPRAFEAVPAWGGVLALAFFLLIFLAGFTSAVSMLEVNVAALEEALGVPRVRATAVLTGLVLVLGLPSALSYSWLDLRVAGVRFLDLMDESVGTLGLPVSALLISVVFTWFAGRSLTAETCGAGRLGRGVRIATKYLIPLVLAVIIVSRLLLSFDFPGWHLLPNVPFIGSLAQAGFTAAILFVLVEAALVGRRFLARRLSRV